MRFLLWILIITSNWLFAQDNPYFPSPDSVGGWRTTTNQDEVLQIASMDVAKLDKAYDFIRTTSPNGGLLVLRHGTLVYERYFGKGQRDATPNLGSVGKPFTSMAVGILMDEYPELFPDGLDQKVFTPNYFPAKVFPLPDERMKDIKLGQLLSFSAGIRGNNPVYVEGKKSSIDPVGPDGWRGMTDRYVFGLEVGDTNGKPFTTRTLWCDPGEGYSYATASIHMASTMVRHISGMELKDYVEKHLAKPLGWGPWGYAYQNTPIENTPGGGGIALRSTDMLRFGYMLLNKGRWEDQRVVAEGYVNAATSASPYNPHFPYSLQFNVNTNGEIESLPKDAFWKVGSGWHCIYVVPSLDLVVWKLGGRDGQYSSGNTGFPELEALPDADQPLTDRPPYEGDIYTRTLELVIDAIVDQALPGQVIHDPYFPNKLVRNEDKDQDGFLDPYFLSGSGDPEGFLYRGTRNPDGTRNGDQPELIQKLSTHGGNAIYLTAVRTHGGDAWKSKRDEPEVYPDDRHNPWKSGEPEGGMNMAILDQWEEWFDEMEQQDILIYFFIYDDAIKLGEQFGWDLDINGELHPEEKSFVQTLVNRFEHHKNIIWCTMEEGQEAGANWQQHISKIAEAIHEADDHDHLIASHQLGGNRFFHEDDPVISQFAIQTDKDAVNTTQELYDWLVKGWEASKDRYSLVMAEDYFHGNRSVPNNDRAEIRTRNWASAMANCYVMVFGFDIANTPEAWLQDLRTLQNFFESTTYNQMNPMPSLSTDINTYVMANKGFDYILYSSETDKYLSIDNLEPGSYLMSWIDCVAGRTAKEDVNIKKAGSHQWKKPKGFGSETALFIYRTDQRPDITKRSNENGVIVNYGTQNTRPVVKDYSFNTTIDKAVNIQLGYSDPDGGPGPYTIEIITQPAHGELTGVGNDLIYAPDKDFTGEDAFTWLVNDGKDDSDVSVIRINVK